jgi:Short C-terminal domain
MVSSRETGRSYQKAIRWRCNFCPPTSLAKRGSAVSGIKPAGEWWQDEKGKWHQGGQRDEGAATSQELAAPATESFTARGRNGQLTVTPTKIIISRKGAMGFISQGHKGEKEIDLAQISAVQFKKPGLGTVGYIQFSFLGGSETKGGMKDAVRDENTILFKGGKVEADFVKAKELIDTYRTRLRGEKQPAAKLGLDDLGHLAQLRDRGIISDEEFASKKKQILDL